MGDDMILLPRSLVAALVDPVTMPFVYIADVAWCRFCNARWDPPITLEHTLDCPIRIAQALLQEARKET